MSRDVGLHWHPGDAGGPVTSAGISSGLCQSLAWLESCLSIAAGRNSVQPNLFPTACSDRVLESAELLDVPIGQRKAGSSCPASSVREQSQNMSPMLADEQEHEAMMVAQHAHLASVQGTLNPAGLQSTRLAPPQQATWLPHLDEHLLAPGQRHTVRNGCAPPPAGAEPVPPAGPQLAWSLPLSTPQQPLGHGPWLHCLLTPSPASARHDACEDHQGWPTGAATPSHHRPDQHRPLQPQQQPPPQHWQQQQQQQQRNISTGFDRPAAVALRHPAPTPGRSELIKQDGPQEQTKRLRGMRSTLLARLAAGTGAADAAESTTGGDNSAKMRWRWLWPTERRDAAGKRPGDPTYDSSTLYIPDAALSSMGAFAQQFWSLKRSCMDLVLFVRHGSFYNLFDVDADVGLQVGLNISGERTANMWKVGCHYNHFPVWAAKVLARGYSVGRVEEFPGQKSGSILQRRLVRIYTSGTRGADVMERGSLSPTAVQPRPLLALTEQHGELEGTMGFCVVSLSLGRLLVGSVADGSGRAALGALLIRASPAEVTACRGGLAEATLKAIRRFGQLDSHNDDGSSGGTVAVTWLPPSRFCSSPGCSSPAGGTAGGSRNRTMGGSGDDEHGVTVHGALNDIREALVPGTGQERSPTVARGDRPPGIHPGDSGQWHRPKAAPSPAASWGQAMPAATAVAVTGGGGGALLAAVSQAGVPWSNDAAALGALSVALRHLKRCRILQRVLPGLRLEWLDVNHRGVLSAEAEHVSDFLELDDRAVMTLELLQDSLGSSHGSLLRFLDCTASHAGRRKLRDWLCRPLASPELIEARLCAVEAFMRVPTAAEALRAGLCALPDCEALLPKAARAFRNMLPASAHEAQDGWGDGPDPSNATWAVSSSREQWSAVTQMLTGLHGCVSAVSQLRQELQAAGEALPPLVRAAVLAAVKAVRVLTQLGDIFDVQADQQLGVADTCGDIQPRPGVSPAYDAAHARCSALSAAADRALQAQVLRLREAGANGALLAKVAWHRPTSDGDGAGLACPSPMRHILEQLYGPRAVRSAGNKVMVAVPALVELCQQLAEAERYKEHALAELLVLARQSFSSGLPAFCEFVDEVAALDVLAAFSIATHPAHAPPGCTFCRPRFVNSSSSSLAGSSSASRLGLAAPPEHGGVPTAVPPPPLLLEDLWHPLVWNACASVTPTSLGLGDLRWAQQAPGTPRQLGNNRLGDANGGPSAGSTAGVLLLTGANTGGKSTLLRATCVAVILAQLGAYVPCARAVLSPVDRIMTRIGAHDRIMSGESTFAVEMSETAAALQRASRHSLVVLDELGRGTGTFDGAAIAHAVLYHLGHTLRCRALFATHYHTLTLDWGSSGAGCVSLGHMDSSIDDSGTFVTSYQLRPGPAPQGSCGISVAGVAGLPRSLLQRAAQQAQAMETRTTAKLQHHRSPRPPCPPRETRQASRAAAAAVAMGDVSRAAAVGDGWGSGALTQAEVVAWRQLVRLACWQGDPAGDQHLAMAVEQTWFAAQAVAFEELW